MKNSLSFTNFASIGIGFAFIVIGMLLMLEQHKIIAKCQITDGTVIEMNQRYSPAKPLSTNQRLGSYYEKPKIRFTTLNDQQIEFEDIKLLSPISIGQKVKVAYKPENPADARLLRFPLFPYGASALGFYVLLASLGRNVQAIVFFLLMIGLGASFGNDLMLIIYASS